MPYYKGYRRIVFLRGVYFIIAAKVVFYACFVLGVGKIIFGAFPLTAHDFVKKKLSNKRGHKQLVTKAGKRKYLMGVLIICSLIVAASAICVMKTLSNKGILAEIGRGLTTANMNAKKDLMDINVSK